MAFLVQPDHSLIFLTGFMASGKSTVGIYLADALGLQFYDLDTEIERRTEKSIAQIFKDEGAAFFRQIEHETLKQLVQHKFALIALGGGTIIEEENLHLLKQHGVIICLLAEIKELWERISDSEKRKLIVGERSLTEDQIFKRIEFLLEIRKPYYDKADIFIDTTNKTIDQIVKEIIVQLELIWYNQK